MIVLIIYFVQGQAEGDINFSNSLIIHERISQSEESICTCARTLKPGKGPANRIYN